MAQSGAGKVPYRDICSISRIHARTVYRTGGEAGSCGWQARSTPLCCWIGYGFARPLGPARSLGGGPVGFFDFRLPSSVIPLAADLLMPGRTWQRCGWHISGVHCGRRIGGVAFTISPKGLFVLAVCACWVPHRCCEPRRMGLRLRLVVVPERWPAIGTKYGAVTNLRGTTFVDSSEKRPAPYPELGRLSHAIVIAAIVGQASRPVLFAAAGWCGS